MKNLLDFFFSFEKLFKEKLVVPFFWLALIVAGLAFFAEALSAISLRPLAATIEFIGFFAEVLLVLVTIRIISEIFVAIFRINDNVSPDGGKSELVDVDPVAEARRAAELATARTRELAQTATDRAKTAVPTAAKPKVYDSKPSASETKDSESLPVKALEPSSVDGQAVKKRGPGRPKGSKNKTTTAKAATSKTATPKTAAAGATKRGPGRPKGSKNKPKTDKPKTDTAKTATATTGGAKRGPGRPKGSKNKTTGTKPGPKKGQAIPRDKDGNLLKKDGTPRKKPGPKPKPEESKADDS